MDRDAASTLRKRLRELREERGRLEEDLLDAPKLLRGSLLEKDQLAGGKRRGRAASYLSVPLGSGRNRFVYVARTNLDQVRKDVAAYRRYRQGLRRLRGLGKEILERFETLLRAQEVSPP